MLSHDEEIVQLVLFLGYRGTHFSGFQAQTGQRTVAGELSFALETLFKRPFELVCAGRTDAGVHAQGQVVNTAFTQVEQSLFSRVRLKKALNALLPDDIVVYKVAFYPPQFSARFDALSREYVYRISLHYPSLLAPEASWFVSGELDVEAMQQAAQVLLGEHDFTSFCKSSSSVDKNCVRTLQAIKITKKNALGETYLEIRVVGSGFLHNMVRIIVGTLVEVGKGQREADSLTETLLACDRRCAGRTAPAQGLTFSKVRYPYIRALRSNKE